MSDEKKRAKQEFSETDDRNTEETYEFEKMYDDPEGQTDNPAKKEKRPEFLKGVLFGVFVSLVCCMAVFLVHYGTISIQDTDASDENGASVLTGLDLRRKLYEVRGILEDNGLYEVDGEKMSAAVMDGVMSGLDDDYAAYYTEEEMEQIREETAGVYYGIGIVLFRNTEQNRYEVLHVYEDTPAQQAGLRAGDILVMVEGESITEKKLSEVTSMIKKQKNGVELTLLRDEQELKIQVVAEQIEVPTVTSRLLENGIGYIAVQEFKTATVDQFRQALQELDEQGMKALIVDLRNNPGGLLDSVCDILDMFIQSDVIVYTEDKNGNRNEENAKSGVEYSGPLAVLVNEYSASASEIFAGAIQDYRLGSIVGTGTYGKGIVQSTFVLHDGSAVKLTTEHYYTPNGQDIQGHGITPDYVVESERDAETDDIETETAEADVQLDQAVELLVKQLAE